MPRPKVIRVILYILAGFLLLLAAFYIFFKIVTRVDEPKITDKEKTSTTKTLKGSNLNSCEHGWLRKAREGWWEMYLEGSPYEIGYAHGLLTRELNYKQEKAFLERLAEIIPSKFYQDFMLGFVRFFNRNLEDYITEEYQQEIFGISRFASPEFDFMGPAYARMLNYHAAHDLGHAVQNMNLVACTAFGAWNGRSADSSLIIGRNFDFYVNDDFAKDKILCFIKPDSGYNFAMVTWAGFAGVVSGMNEQGLTITLNAAKSSIPLGARTPVSLLAREILQYASTIEEAFKIAQSRETFVAESFLIGSAKDHKAVLIEKSPEKISLYDPGKDYLIVTNNFLSDSFLNDPLNVENMENETSVYRYKRVEELLYDNQPVSPEIAARILRDYMGMQGKDIGLGNEKAVNQFIAHHSIIFQPGQRRLWIAGPPYQLGEYWCYDLDSVFVTVGVETVGAETVGAETVGAETVGAETVGRDVACNVSTVFSMNIPADILQITTIYPTLQKYRTLARQIESGEYPVNAADSLIKYNPEFFHTYRVLGDYFKAKGEEQRAEGFYRMALEKEAPSAAERLSVVDSR